MSKQPKYIQDFERSVKLMIDMFCKKQDLDYEFSVGDDITDVICCSGHYYFNLSDVYHDMKTNQPKGLIIEWIDSVTDHNLSNLKEKTFINYKSWVKGLRY